MDVVARAIALACRKHQGQMRKDQVTPYVVHPIRVMLTVLREFGHAEPDTLAAAALHDTIEDTQTDFDDVMAECGPLVAKYVALLTKDKRLQEEERERAYFAGLADAPLPVRLCKVADTLDNLRDARRGGNWPKTVGKAEKLFELWSGVPELAAPLALLRAEIAAGDPRDKK